MIDFAAKSRVIAVLGPTNTGKTHLALERMSGYGSAMIGFPLRLLARENYDRLVARKGKNAVALMTGEEKILPPHATHFVCTVEAMPVDRLVDFLAIDEIQLCADPDRGHVFTDRLLHARGRVETMFMGADTIRPLLKKLVPDAEYVARPRFSRLTYTGAKKLARLPSRSAIVAFSAADVYGMAEMIRRQKGGAAVILGALSPRTRNAQLGLYQSGEVDYLVATDAIGMGLNMDVGHVAFAAARKFDGRHPRLLEASEVGQIAGRAGRHMNDGTFGVTADLPGLDPAIVDAVENHEFPPLKHLQWRNSDLRFTSIRALLSSLERLPDHAGLVRARDADDHLALLAMLANEDIGSIAVTPAEIRLLWDVCQIPDFGKISPDQHARLLSSIYRHLLAGDGLIPADWMEAQIRRVERTDGDIEALVGRIAAIRIWTYIANRNDWLKDAMFWRERTRAVEDRLSDALHEKLTQRFVDRRTAHLVRRLKDGQTMLSSVAKDGAVAVDGHFVGRLDGFRFRPDDADAGQATRALISAANRSLGVEIAHRIEALLQDHDEFFSLASDGILLWRGQAVAKLGASAELLFPTVALLTSDLVEPHQRLKVQARLADWLADHIAERLPELCSALLAPLNGAARGVVWQLGQSLGSMPRKNIADLLGALTEEDRRELSRLGVRFGTESIYFLSALKPRAQFLRNLLWSNGRGVEPPAPPKAGAISISNFGDAPADYPERIGFRRLGVIAVRIDILERFLVDLRKLGGKDGLFKITAPLCIRLGLKEKDMKGVLERLGYQSNVDGEWSRRPRSKKRRPTERKNNDSPFASLAALQEKRRK